MKITWTREAIDNLFEIEGYISQDNPEKAAGFVDFLMDQAEYLSDTPDMGRMVPELSDPTTRELIIKNYRIVYRHFDNEIQIITVFEAHRIFPLDH